MKEIREGKTSFKKKTLKEATKVIFEVLKEWPIYPPTDSQCI
jgi:hypothetical protein